MKHLVFGGSFDPVHRGHIAMATAAQEQWQPDRLSWLPSRLAPHKLDAQAMAPQHRQAMLELVLAERPGNEVLCLDEFSREGPSFTVDTLQDLMVQDPSQELAFLLGGDSLSHLATWRDLPRLLQMAHFVFAPRVGYGPQQEQEFRQSLAPEIAARWRVTWLSMEPVLCSSSELRKALKAGAPCSDLPPAVAEYIVAHRLYQGSTRA